MSPLDAVFLHLDTDVAPLHVGSVLVFEGPTPTYDEVCDRFAALLHLVPRYRQVVRTVPLQVAAPTWADDPHFSLRYHIRHGALPTPGDHEQLVTMYARIMETHLDKRRPLWETWLVEGLEGGRWALMNKVHHSMIDGVSGSDMMGLLLERDPAAPPPPPAPSWEPTAAPSTVDAVAGAAVDVVRFPLRRVGRMLGTVRSAPDLARLRVGAAAKSAVPLAGVAVPSRINLNGSVGPHRRWDWATLSLADVRAVKSAYGTTVNDVVQAAVAGGLRSWLRELAVPVEGRTLRTMVPVSMRDPSQRQQQNNRVAAMFLDLPVGEPDPVRRLERVARDLGHLKSQGMALSVDSIVKSADFVPPTLFALGARVAAVMHQPVVSTVTTNVPGPPYPMYLLGRRMVGMVPFIPIATGLRLTLGIFSYDGTMTVGVTTDADSFPQVGALCRAIEGAMAELVAAAEPRSDSEPEASSG